MRVCLGGLELGRGIKIDGHYEIVLRAFRLRPLTQTVMMRNTFYIKYKVSQIQTERDLLLIDTASKMFDISYVVILCLLPLGRRSKFERSLCTFASL